MKFIQPEIFKKYSEIIFGFSTKIGLNRGAPFYFNMSFSTGDDEKIVAENRKAFFNALGLSGDKIAVQKQIHSDIVKYVTCGGMNGESDAMITNRSNLGLAISTADCTPVFIYDPENEVIAAVHSGWRGTVKKILLKTLQRLVDDFDSNPGKLITYIGPSISRKNYEVGNEVADLFDEKYKTKKADKYLLDVSGANYDMLINFGLQKNNIETSSLCTYEEKELLHSYRRDGIKSGRSMGIIALRD